MNKLKFATLTAAMALAASVASAATSITAGNSYSASAVGSGTNEALLGGESDSFTFTASGNVVVRDFIAVSGTAASEEALLNLVFGYTGDSIDDDSGNTFDDVLDRGATWSGSSGLPGFRLNDGESFTFTFDNTNAFAEGSNEVTAGLTFVTAAVPVPAAGLLLLTALAGGAFASRRKKA